jgi:GNAT superfamily N-acetyltransferase
MPPTLEGIAFRVQDPSAMSELRQVWGAMVSGHLHFQGGITISAVSRNAHAGLLTAYTRTLPAPLQVALETYIDLLEVEPEFRGRGVATRLIQMALAHAKSLGHYQIRAWSSEDKTETIPTWARLGFGFHPSSNSPQGKEVRGFFVTKTL